MENKSKILLFFERGNLILFFIFSLILLIVKSIGITQILGITIDYNLILILLLLSIVVHFITSSFKTQLDSTDIIAKVNKIELNLIVEIEKIQPKLIDSIRGVEKRNFTDITKLDSYVARRIKEAKHSVLDLNWQDFKDEPSSDYQLNRVITDNEIDISIESFCKRKRNIEIKRNSIYEEIFTFPETNKENFEKMKKRIEYGDIYSCYFYETKNINKVLKFPKLQFVIIDHEEVIFASSEYSGNLCAIKDKKLVSICLNYFTQAKTLSNIIKEKNKPANNTIIKSIEKNFIEKREANNGFA